jgi:chaperonin GroEL
MHQVEVPEILYDENAKLKLLKGVEKLTKAVQVTLGPKGKTVAISLLGSVPHLTKDGATVARSLTLVDPYENIGASLVREAAQSSAEVVGDGTTTSIVLAYNILKNSQQLVVAGQSANELAEGMKQAYNLVLAELEKKKTLVNSDSLLRDVATISANGEAGLGQLIADAINRVGYDGAISVQQAKGFDTKLDIVDGTFISRGFESPYFVTHNAKQIVELESPLVLIVNDSVVSMHSILPALEHAISCGRSLLLVCNEISGEALQTLVLNKIKGGLKVCAITRVRLCKNPSNAGLGSFDEC